MEEVQKTVALVLADVRRAGDAAIVRWTRRFDRLPRYAVRDIRVPVPRRCGAGNPALERAIRTAVARVRAFHAAEMRHVHQAWSIRRGGLRVGQRVRPVDTVGVYVPGGKYGYNYISSILMGVIPAQEAGVRRVVLATPPGNVTRPVLFTASLLGLREVYAVGGIQAIGALAYGTRTVPRVDMVIGPGNRWVTEAKRQVFGEVGIDLLAGPSEVAVVADRSVPTDAVAYELLAQAEHDPDARSVLIAMDQETARRVCARVRALQPEIAQRIACTIVRSDAEMVRHINTLAPEHLTVLAERCVAAAERGVVNAGAIFLGGCASAVFGDYLAGPSHILPTARTARFSSGVSVQTFLKRSSVVAFSPTGVRPLVHATATLAAAEGLPRHADVVCTKRVRRGNP